MFFQFFSFSFFLFIFYAHSWTRLPLVANLIVNWRLESNRTTNFMFTWDSCLIVKIAFAKPFFHLTSISILLIITLLSFLNFGMFKKLKHQRIVLNFFFIILNVESLCAKHIHLNLFQCVNNSKSFQFAFKFLFHDVIFVINYAHRSRKVNQSIHCLQEQSGTIFYHVL